MGLTARLLAEQDRWILWLPVLIGVGIAVYFALPVEPRPWIGGAVLAVLAAVGWAARRHPVAFPVLLAVGAVALGFCAAQARTEAVRAPVLERRVGPVEVTGTVVEIEMLDKGWRVILEELRIAGRGGAALRRPIEVPERIRVRIGVGDALELRPGQRIVVSAILMPPPEPALPGGFDFPRRAWFDRLGGVGFAVGAPRVAEREAAGFSFGEAVAAWRADVTRRIREVLPGDVGGVSAALISGDRGGLSEATLQAYRDSGLAHLLSISGLHMSMIAGLVFFLVRAGCAAVPPIALRCDVKKWAAVVALAATAGYLALSGGGVPTLRAFVMSAVVLGAVLLDRAALSMRTVALAATLVLLTQPDALMGPSFQMSFAAVVALIACYEALAGPMARWRSRQDGGRAWGRAVVLYVGGLVLTTLVAGTATAPYSIYHFHNFAPFGVAANMVAVPVTGVWIMPAALASLLFMPLGWDGPFLTVMGAGVDLVNATAVAVAEWPGARLMVPAVPSSFAVLVTLGGLWLCLWRRSWRLAGIAVMVAAVVPALTHQRPDILIDGAGEMLALRRVDDGRMVVAPGGARDGFARRMWAESEGVADLPEIGEAGDEAAGVLCDAVGCAARYPRHKLAWLTHRGGFAEDCAWADVLISTEWPPRACAAPVIVGPATTRRQGAVALWLRADGGVRVLTARAVMGERPWMPRAWAAHTGEPMN